MGSIQSGLDEVTNKFLDTVINNRQFNNLPEMITRFDALMSMLSKEEAVRVISAVDLGAEQQSQVRSALRDRLGADDFTVTYEVDPSIVGGLQVYFGNSFLDCSLNSRLNRVYNEVEGLSI